MNELYHYGVKGMKWGVRRYQNPDGTMINGGTLKKGSTFTRIGNGEISPNEAGGLYVSQSKVDGARYTKLLGQKKFSNTRNTAYKTTIKAKKNLKIASDEESTQIFLDFFKNNPDRVKELYGNGRFDPRKIDRTIMPLVTSYRNKGLKNTVNNYAAGTKEAKRFAFLVSTLLGDPKYAGLSKDIFDEFRKKGYDAMPDFHDLMGGDSDTATIIFNTDKLEVFERTLIDPSVRSEADRICREAGDMSLDNVISKIRRSSGLLIQKDIDNHELYHHGVPGMKWGVRKEYEPVGKKSLSNQVGSIGKIRSIKEKIPKKIPKSHRYSKGADGKLDKAGKTRKTVNMLSGFTASFLTNMTFASPIGRDAMDMLLGNISNPVVSMITRNTIRRGTSFAANRAAVKVSDIVLDNMFGYDYGRGEAYVRK